MCAVSVRSNAPKACGPGALLTALLCAIAPSTWALDDDAAMVVAFADTGTAAYSRPQFEISTSAAPRFDSEGPQQRAPRIDMTLLSRNRPSLGLSLGVANLDGSAFTGGAPFAPPGPSADVGLRWRSEAPGNYRVEVSAWRHLATPDALEMVLQRQATYGARVEMQLPSARHGFVADRGFLGMQLESGARITVRRKEHVPMLYYRNQF
jgi:hypothetical protein